MRTNLKHCVVALLMASQLVILMTCSTNTENEDVLSKIRASVDAGDFKVARELISAELAQLPDLRERSELEFEAIRMDRIEHDFVKTEADVMEYISEFYPWGGAEDLERWEQSGALEMMRIDGEKRYFRWAARNLFRIDPEMKLVWTKAHPEAAVTSGSGATSDIDSHNLKVMQTAEVTENPYVLPVRLRITQSITVPADKIPAGETLRCWIPYPREIEGRQTEIQIESATPQVHTLAPPQAIQRTAYFEQTTTEGEDTHFSITYSYTARGTYRNIEAEKVSPVLASAELAPYLAERPPHIVFTDELRKLSREIIGVETNPYRQAQKLFEWVDVNIPWASAREYSTIRNIPAYAIRNGHGDCGIQTLTFMTLCRLNGIPTRWQSGWEFQPPNDSMHDWGMIFFEPYGWVPMDVTYGLRNSDDPKLKWFYLSGMDSYRLIFNDDYSQPFTPPKTFPRSETVDSQRGEVEWRGGNLYFTDWNWDFQWELLNNATANL